MNYILTHNTLKGKEMEKVKSKKITFAIEREIKETAEKKFQEYGLSFGNGLKVLLKLMIDEKVQIFK